MERGAETGTSRRCWRCSREVGGLSFAMKEGDQDVNKCVRCALRHRPMLKRSALASVIVGTVLVLLNQGDLLLSGQLPPVLYWKVPLTYLVPFAVATWGALSNARSR